jgi:hypothetical protein
MNRHRGSLVVFLLSVMVLAACGGGGSDENTVSSVTGTAAASDAGSNDGAPLDQTLLDRADSVAEKTTSDGGKVVVAVECESQMGGNLVHVGVVGVPPGTYTGTLEPSAGGDLTVQVISDGPAQGARQATLDEPEYTVTFADIDGGTSLTIAGCGG